MDNLQDKTFSVIIENTLTDYDRKTLSKLYLPLVGNIALSLYDYFFILEVPGEKESKNMYFKDLFISFGISEIDFKNNIDKLGALGLIDIYYKNNNYVFVVKKVLSPYEYFNNNELRRALELKIGEEAALNLCYELLVRRNSLKNYENITKSFDEVFDIIDYNNLNNYEGVGINTTNNGIKIKNTKFDYDRFLLLIEGRGILDKDYVNSITFKDIILRYAYFYDIKVMDMYDLVIKSVSDGKLDQDHLLYEVMKLNDEVNNNKVIIAKTDAKVENKTVVTLESKSPNEIYKALTGYNLISQEIKMFDMLATETGLPMGVINASLVYVVKTKGNKVPSHNYFLKILTSWKRDGIYNTTDALNYVENMDKETKSKQKTVKPVPKWYNEEQNKTKEEQVSEEDLRELEAFFGRGTKDGN